MTTTLLNDAVLEAPPTEEPAGISPSATPPEEVGWLKTIPDLTDDVRNDPSLKPISSLSNLIKSYVNAQKMVGADKLVVPSKDAGDDAWKSVFQKLGVPEKVEDYKVAPPEEVPVDDQYFKSFIENAHKAGLLPGQAKKLADFNIRFATDQAKELQTREEHALLERMEQFKKEEGDNYNTVVRNAKLVIKQFDDETESFNELITTDHRVGSNPKLIRFLSRIAEHLTEDTFRATAISNVGTTTEEAHAKMNTIMGDKNSPYWSKEHPDHGRIVQEVHRLMNQTMQA